MSAFNTKRVYMDDSYPIAEFKIDGFIYSFTIKGIPEKEWSWFLNVVYNEMSFIHNRAYLKGKNEIRQKITDTLKLE